jgi:cobalt-zinc-cadmium efflux system membrane fusion protein
MPTNRYLLHVLTATLLYVPQRMITRVIVKDTQGLPVSLVLKARQIEEAGITFSGTVQQTADRLIDCSGNLEVPTANTIQVPVPAGGTLKSLFIRPGSRVEAGTVLATLESIDFVKLQQEYLETKNQFAYFHDEYERQGELTIENASSVKKMQAARRDYLSAETKLGALKVQLTMLGIQADSVDVDHLSPEIVITAPNTGHIYEIFAAPGVFMNTGDRLVEIITTKNLQVRLKVPERYFPALRRGQTVYFTLPLDSLFVNEARISWISGRIDPLSQTFSANAVIVKTGSALIPGISVKAKIRAGVDTLRLFLLKP